MQSNMLEPVEGADSDLLNAAEEKHDTDHSSKNDSAAGKHRLFGRQKPLHHFLGGGKSADILLWRNKNLTAGIFAAGTVIWLLFECIGYHLITFICHSLILALSIFFLWSNLAVFNGIMVNVKDHFFSDKDRSPPKIPEVKLPEDLLPRVGMLLRNEINSASKTFKDVASTNDLKTFLSATMILWILSIVGNWFNFLTLLYLVFVMVVTMPMLYETHEDLVDTYAEKALDELRKQYAILDEKVLQKIPISSFQKPHRS